jgi:hypothetical protein
MKNEADVFWELMKLFSWAAAAFAHKDARENYVLLFAKI